MASKLVTIDSYIYSKIKGKITVTFSKFDNENNLTYQKEYRNVTTSSAHRLDTLMAKLKLKNKVQINAYFGGVKSLHLAVSYHIS